MSFQVQPQQQPQLQQPQQPVQVYPNTITNQEPPQHSNGSFGTVFVVLAVIVVISAIACCLGRFCNRRYHGSSHSQKPSKQQKQKPNALPKGGFHPKAGFHTKDQGDIEMGFDKRIPTAKPNGNGNAKPNGNGNGYGRGNGHGHGQRHGYGNGHSLGHGVGRGPKPPTNGDMKGFDLKFGEGELRAGA